MSFVKAWTSFEVNIFFNFDFLVLESMLYGSRSFSSPERDNSPMIGGFGCLLIMRIRVRDGDYCR
uniref:Uncharacterized protein n=1 Tax=Romanomermis culicivorax TaxID=13658 RepID=A0A915ILG2_ROMCU